jgi:hypothetical protein
MTSEKVPMRTPWGEVAPSHRDHSGWTTASTALSVVRRGFDERTTSKI